MLLAGIVPDMTPLVEQLLVANPPLAARCIAESGGTKPDESVVQAVQQHFVGLAADPRVEIAQRNAAGVAVNYLGDPRPGVGLRSDGLPDIDWVLVPDKDPKSGRREFIYGDGERRTEPDFWIARYPITYRQFQAFLDAPDGFRNALVERAGCVAGAPVELGEQWFKHWNHPRDHVSWYDAMAFCRWLTAKAKERPDLLPVDLTAAGTGRSPCPPEWQWEKAARGHDGRQYPWGLERSTSQDMPTSTRLITRLGRTTCRRPPRWACTPSGSFALWRRRPERQRVGMVPERVRKTGACSGWKATPLRVLRGGSWDDFHVFAAAPVRTGTSRTTVTSTMVFGWWLWVGAPMPKLWPLLL